MSGVRRICSNCGQGQCDRRASAPDGVKCGLWCPEGCLLPMETRGYTETEMWGPSSNRWSWQTRLAHVWEKRKSMKVMQ
jgi:hypothetical protein